MDGAKNLAPLILFWLLLATAIELLPEMLLLGDNGWHRINRL
jgi:hypothetical protein